MPTDQSTVFVPKHFFSIWLFIFCHNLVKGLNLLNLQISELNLVYFLRKLQISWEKGSEKTKKYKSHCGMKSIYQMVIGIEYPLIIEAYEVWTQTGLNTHQRKMVYRKKMQIIWEKERIFFNTFIFNEHNTQRRPQCWILALNYTSYISWSYLKFV